MVEDGGGIRSRRIARETPHKPRRVVKKLVRVQPVNHAALGSNRVSKQIRFVGKKTRERNAQPARRRRKKVKIKKIKKKISSSSLIPEESKKRRKVIVTKKRLLHNTEPPFYIDATNSLDSPAETATFRSIEDDFKALGLDNPEDAIAYTDDGVPYLKGGLLYTKNGLSFVQDNLGDEDGDEEEVELDDTGPTRLHFSLSDDEYDDEYEEREGEPSDDDEERDNDIDDDLEEDSREYEDHTNSIEEDTEPQQHDVSESPRGYSSTENDVDSQIYNNFISEVRSEEGEVTEIDPDTLDSNKFQEQHNYATQASDTETSSAQLEDDTEPESVEHSTRTWEDNRENEISTDVDGQFNTITNHDELQGETTASTLETATGDFDFDVTTTALPPVEDTERYGTTVAGDNESTTEAIEKLDSNQSTLSFDNVTEAERFETFINNDITIYEIQTNTVGYDTSTFDQTTDDTTLDVTTIEQNEIATYRDDETHQGTEQSSGSTRGDDAEQETTVADDDSNETTEDAETRQQSVADYEPFFPELSEFPDPPILLLKTTVLATTEYETKTVLQSKNRTYTLLITRLNGDEQIITSTTEVKPHTKTIVVTEPTVRYTTITLDLDTKDTLPYIPFSITPENNNTREGELITLRPLSVPFVCRVSDEIFVHTSE